MGIYGIGNTLISQMSQIFEIHPQKEKVIGVKGTVNDIFAIIPDCLQRLSVFQTMADSMPASTRRKS